MSTPPDDSDDIPPDELRSGDSAAWDRLARRWDGPLRAFIYRLSGDADAADEIASETLVRAWKARASIRNAKLSTWLFGIALNLLRNRRRGWFRRMKWLIGEDPENPAHEARDPADAPDAALLADERARRVRDAVLALPPDLREPLVLAVYERLSHADIAATLGTTAKTVEHRLASARTRLARSLADLRPH